MIDLISSLFNEGDSIRIEYGNANKIVKGTILKILPGSIALKLEDGGITGIKGDEIVSFDSVGNVESDLQTPSTETAIINDVNQAQIDEVPVLSSQDNSTSDKKDCFLSFKPGDIIPLDKLYEIDPKLKGVRKVHISKTAETSSTVIEESSQPISTSALKIAEENKPHAKKKYSMIGSDFQALAPLVKEQHEMENLKTVPAIGTISFVKKDGNYGFIHDPRTGHNLYFSLEDIVGDFHPVIDKGVIYTEITNALGYKAICVHKSGTIKDLLALSEEVAQKGNITEAIRILEHILDVYPDNFTADDAKKQLSKKVRAKKSYAQYAYNGDYYSKGKECALRKDYEKAVEYYLSAIKEQNRRESAIKDLAMLYVQLFRSDYKSKSAHWKKAALSLLQKYVEFLPQNLTTQNFLLHNCFLPLQEYEKLIEIIDNIIENYDIESDAIKCSTLLYTKAVALVRLQRTDEAGNAIEDSLSYNPQNASANQLKDLMKSGEVLNDEQIEQIASTAEFNILSGGLSPFILRTLDRYDEYAGVKTKDLESRHFTPATLKDVRDVIKTTEARAKLRATYRLTEGKLMQEIEPSDEIGLRKVMARYCNAMALSHISENSPLDVIRFFYNESFALEEEWSSNTRQIILYLLTHIHTYSELIKDSGKSYSLEDTLSLLLPKANDHKIWDSILTMCLNNGTIFVELFTRLYNNKTWKPLAISELEHFDLENASPTISKENFIDRWNSIREKRLNQQKRLNANIKSLGNCKSIEELVASMENLRQYREDWMLPLDTTRINTIINFILPALESFVKSTGYRNKESNYNNANGQTQQFVDEIEKGPTKLSYEVILPLMDRTLELLKEAFDDVIRMSEPKISLNLLSTETVINENGLVSLQISVTNHKDSSPIKEVSVDLVEDNDIKLVKQEATQLHYNAIEGGESSIFKLDIRVSDEIIKNKATAVNLLCKYKSGDKSCEQRAQVSLSLYSPRRLQTYRQSVCPHRRWRSCARQFKHVLWPESLYRQYR